MNWVATIFFWYYTIWWFDIPMHFLGGVFLGLVFGYVLLRHGIKNFSQKTFFYGILAIFIVGILWEIFEFNIDTFITFRDQNIIDTLSDICFDLAGGLFALQYLKKYLPFMISSNTINSNLEDTQV